MIAIGLSKQQPLDANPKQYNKLAIQYFFSLFKKQRKQF